ncbi:hypothetical protein G7K_5915-t1 [Saitoella complicata NRRL Y-17804]|uniref:Uncharacterized protein n=1 Tax=Saitoella complicata (strain BCRC 22490 / CBS 7301 / JCM 7358 / NBRC 10748 / NRRL Y-17804) TaxID=698492 RepID=A0A0E9NPQ3_SAICN|nr:hypothetical protein G7K_5915-t1 [Saitoella complicata NRRL Y-17804]
MFTYHHNVAVLRLVFSSLPHARTNRGHEMSVIHRTLRPPVHSLTLLTGFISFLPPAEHALDNYTDIHRQWFLITSRTIGGTSTTHKRFFPLAFAILHAAVGHFNASPLNIKEGPHVPSFKPRHMSEPRQTFSVYSFKRGRAC